MRAPKNLVKVKYKGYFPDGKVFYDNALNVFPKIKALIGNID